MAINPNAVLPPHRPAVPYEGKRKTNLATWLWIGAFLLFIAACGFGAFWSNNGGKIGCVLTQCDKNPVGLPASWAEIVVAADEEAQKAMAGAVLDGVSAEPVAQWAKGWSIAMTLKMRFRYVAPDGETLYVDLYDTDPQASVNAWGPAVDPRLRSTRDSSDIGRQAYERLKADAGRRREAILKAKATPRQAEALTWKEGLAEARKDHTKIAPWIYLEFGYGPEDEGKPPTWRVKYTPVSPDDPPGLLGPFSSIFAQSSSFEVDAATGEILKRDLDDSFLSD